MRARVVDKLVKLVSVDPGIRGCGVAAFEDGFLVAAAFVVASRSKDSRASGAATTARAVVEWLIGRGADELAVEWPRVYATAIRRGDSKADPNDLLPLAGVDAAIASILGGVPVYSYVPSEWKGQMPKDVCQRRVKTRLSLAESHIAETATSGASGHNVWDAVGIGLHHLGRFAPQRRSSKNEKEET